MNDFLKKIIGDVGVVPLQSCLDSFASNFRGALNPEWSEKEGKYEVLFYKDEIEHIASFDSQGTLEGYKMHLNEKLLPEAIRVELELHWEIMNVVFINAGNHVRYEVIVRDTQLQRSLILLDHLGRTLEKRHL